MFLLKRIGKSNGISNIIFAILIVGLIGVTAFFVKVYLPPTNEDFLENFESPTLSAVTAGTIESLPPVTAIVTLDDALIDLENLGCSVVNVTEVESQGSGVGFFLEYSEFRKVAYKQKLAFLLYYYDDDYDKPFPYLTTVFENINVVWFPERELLEIEEPHKFEKVEIQTAYAVKTTGTGWNITMELKNTGSAASTLLRCFINEVPVPQGNYDATGFPGSNSIAVSFPYSGLTIASGESLTLQVYIDEGYSSLSSGTTINVKIHSAGGMDYIKLVKLV